MLKYIPLTRAIATTIVLFALLSVYDISILGVLPQDRFPPKFDLYYLIRSVACIALSLWIVKRIPKEGFKEISDPKLSKGLHAISALSIIQIFGILALFLYSPRLLFVLGKENSLVETLSFAFPLAASVCLMVSAFRFHGTGSSRTALVAALFGMLSFLIAMEEVSWMQQYLKFETPAAFDANMQNETNLHNFASKIVNNVYYIGSFAFLAFGPFVFASARDVISPWIQDVLPSRIVAISCISMSACNWEMWNIFPIQMIFWISVLVLIRFHREGSIPGSNFAWLTKILIAGIILAQFSFLVWGDRMVRTHDLGEYKEGLITFGLLVYSIEILLRSKRLSEASRTAI